MEILVIGGGLAGCEAAWQLAQRGHHVRLVEMRPVATTPAHQTEGLAELVCTNSFKSEDPTNAHGLLKREMQAFGSLLLRAAADARVPAGAALAVDRRAFSERMTEFVISHPRIRIERREITTLPEGPSIIATGPLTSDALTGDIQRLLGDDGLAFYDAIAPIIAFDSVDLDKAYFASRYGKGDAEDYLNCPLERDQYLAFHSALIAADTYPGHDWENIPFFEGCLPIEVMARRGPDTLRFGPMKPVGLRDPRTGRAPYAVVQLRREDRAGRMWNLVGFQTRLRTGEQRRVIRLIPGLEEAEFLRYGSIHRNTYLNFPATLLPYGAPRARPDLLFAGQLTGVEGYTESASSGIMAAVNLDRIVRGLDPALPPGTTMTGALWRYLREANPASFQPMNSNFGLVDQPAGNVRDKRLRRQQMAERALHDLRAWMDANGIEPVAVPAPSPEAALAAAPSQAAHRTASDDGPA